MFSKLIQLLLAGGALFALPLAADNDVISSLEWQKRIFLIDGGKDVDAVLSVLKDADADIADRDVAWFVLDGDKVRANLVRQIPPSFSARVRSHYLKQGKYRAVLIGKDGGVKRRYTDPDVAGMMALIDTMPMRRREMQEQQR